MIKLMASKPSASFLLIDLGNTTAKLRLADPDRLRGATRRLPTAALLAPDGPAALQKTLAGWRYDRVVAVVGRAGGGARSGRHACPA